MKQIFKKGDRVYHHKYGWGTFNYYAKYAREKTIITFTECKVVFDNTPEESKDYGFSIVYESELSFTEYSLQGFSQERPINYEDYIGCWGRFWDDGMSKVEGVLSYVDTNAAYPYSRKGGAEYGNFEPYPQEVLIALELINEK